MQVNTWHVYKVLWVLKWIVINVMKVIDIGMSWILVTVEDHFEDKKLGVETSSFTSFKNIQPNFAFGTYKDGTYYQPAAYKILKRCLNCFQLTENDVFIDIGSGKGRVIFFFAQFKLYKVIGIEFHKELVNIAKRNLSHLKRNHCPIEIVECDAAIADLSKGTIFFLYNPFGLKTLTAVLNNIKNSLISNPRTIRIIYINGVHADLFLKQDWLEKEDIIYYPENSIWHNKNS